LKVVVVLDQNRTEAFEHENLKVIDKNPEGDITLDAKLVIRYGKDTVAVFTKWEYWYEVRK